MEEKQFVISHSHPAIAGHFPGSPVIPGVLLISRALSEISFSQPYQLKKVRFLKMVLPGDTVTVSLTLQKENNYQLQLTVAEQMVAKAKVIKEATMNEPPALYHPKDTGRIIEHCTIDQRIPHSGTMCLLQKALYWDETSMLAEAISHQSEENPLLEIQDGQSMLPAFVLPEYVSQVIALHGATLACEQTELTQLGENKPRIGYLAIIPKGSFFCSDLKRITSPLRIYIEVLLKQENACFYQFSVTAKEQLLAEGEVGIVLDKL